MLITVNSGYRWPVDPTSHVQIMVSVFGLSWCCDPQRFILVQKEKKGSICGPRLPTQPATHAGVALALRPARGWKGADVLVVGSGTGTSKPLTSTYYYYPNFHPCWAAHLYLRPHPTHRPHEPPQGFLTVYSFSDLLFAAFLL